MVMKSSLGQTCHLLFNSVSLTGGPAFRASALEGVSKKYPGWKARDFCIFALKLKLSISGSGLAFSLQLWEPRLIDCILMPSHVLHIFIFNPQLPCQVNFPLTHRTFDQKEEKNEIICPKLYVYNRPRVLTQMPYQVHFYAIVACCGCLSLLTLANK